MISFAGRRLAWTAVVLVGITVITFTATLVSPIDPVRVYVGHRASQETIDAVSERFGLDQPVPVRYVNYVWGAVQGDLGESLHTRQPVMDSILRRLPATIKLAVGGLIVAILFGLAIGVLSAYFPGGLLDRSLLLVTLGLAVTPYFVIGFVLLFWLGFSLQIFPLGGDANLSSLVLPSLTLGLASGAWYARLLRSTLLSTAGEPFIRTARSKGLSAQYVMWRHILRASLPPVVAMVALDLGVFLGGVLVVEKVFAWPGLGSLAWEAVQANDIPLVMGTVLVAGLFISLFNLGADLLNGWLDPRAVLR